MDVHGRDLRYFAMVAEELHFTRAAERLFISQPALSKQIRMLERSLGVALFVREGRSVTLTPAGEALLPYARETLAAWGRGLQAVEESKRAAASTLVVGMSTSPGRGGLVPAIRSRFSEAAPLARLELRQVGWEDPTAGLVDESSDVAFVWLPIPAHERYAWIVVAEEPCLVALPETHPRAGDPELAFDDLRNEPFLALPESAGPLRDYWLATDQRCDAPTIGAIITTPDETYEALVDGRGICLLAEGNAVSLMRGGVVIRPVHGVPPCTLALAWRAGDPNPLIRVYVDSARQVVQPGGRGRRW